MCSSRASQQGLQLRMQLKGRAWVKATAGARMPITTGQEMAPGQNGGVL